MGSRKIIWILILSTLGISLYRCKTEEIILHGEISGYVTDAETSQPVEAAKVNLSPVDDSTSTVSDGTYHFRNLLPGNYVVTVTKNIYNEQNKNTTVVPTQISVINFTLNRRAARHISDAYLDFGSDTLTKEFTISNIGSGRMTYFFESDKEWIKIKPTYGNVGDETDTITVTIDKTSLSETKYIETIKLFSIVGNEVILDTVGVYLNGLMDQDMNYYSVVTISTQTWMAENLNVGRFTMLASNQGNNGIIEKYCYNNEHNNCNIYGGLYRWDEMIQYNPQDSGKTGITQGVCPVGWHIPTKKEWSTLVDYLGGKPIAGGKLKEVGTTHWGDYNIGATNESGFSALPGGIKSLEFTGDTIWQNIGYFGYWWSSTVDDRQNYLYYYYALVLVSSSIRAFSAQEQGDNGFIDCGLSVRCVKNPPKNK